MKAKAAFLLFLLAAAPLALAVDTGPVIQNLKVDASAFPSVSARCRVVDKGTGAPVLTLRTGDFQLLEGATSASPVVEMRREGPAAVMIAVDTSGTMRAILPAVKDALKAFVQSLPAEDSVALITIDDDTQIGRRFTTDKADIAAQIDSLQISGRSTLLYKGVKDGLSLLDSTGVQGPKMLLVVSDGKDEGSTFKLEDCIADARKIGVGIFALQVGTAADIDPFSLLKMAQESGGAYLRQINSAQLSQQLGELAQAGLQPYFITWTSSLAPNGGIQKASLTVTNGDLQASAALSVKTPEPPPPPEVKWYLVRRNQYIGGGAAVAVLLLVALMILMLKRGKRKRAEMEEIQRQEVDRVKDEMSRGMDSMREEVQNLQGELNAKSRVMPAPPPAKRRTMIAGAGTQLPSYRSASIAILSGPLTGSRLPLPNTMATVGRELDNNIVLQDERVSAHHACIECEAGIYYLVDVGSANGTFVNEARISSRFPLENGAQIRMGGVSMVFQGQ